MDKFGASSADRTSPGRTSTNRGAELLPGTPETQPATPPVPFGTRPGPTPGMRVTRRGVAVFRMVFLVGITGFIVAAVVASVVAGLIIAINGRLQ
jgi:hypothetical protein